MADMFAICRPQPNWMPKKPNDMFQICQNERRGFSAMVVWVSLIAGPPQGQAGSVTAAGESARRAGHVRQPPWSRTGWPAPSGHPGVPAPGPSESGGGPRQAQPPVDAAGGAGMLNRSVMPNRSVIINAA